MDTSKVRKRMPVSTLLDPKIVMPAIGQAFVKLNPATLLKNPVIFVLEIVTALTTVLLVRDLVQHAPAPASPSRSSSGCGSQCCSPTSRKRWRKAAARRRPTRCAVAASRRRPRSFRIRKSAPASRRVRALDLRAGDYVVSRPVTSSPAMAMSSKASRRSTRRRSPVNPRRSFANPAATVRR